MKIRTIITQDAEVDDQNSLRHFLLYTNEVELQGIVQTSSVFHWQGQKGAVGPKVKINNFSGIEEKVAPYDQPYRWTGTDWMQAQIDEYEVIYPNLIKHAEGYPTPDYLRSIIKIGNVGYSGDMSGATEGSELIRKCILDKDPRPLYIQVWGGTNTIAQALKDIEEEYSGQYNWPALHKKISEKVILTACGEQDDTYRSYIAESWPDIMFVVTLQMDSYAYSWKTMPECESKDAFYADYMKQHILLEENPLMKNYCTWLDGKYYEGEDEHGQFGTNPETVNMLKFMIPENWPVYEKNEFISEGDSPTFFWMFNWGLRTIEDFRNGGFSGRYYLDSEEKNSRGDALNYWKVLEDEFTDRSGKTTKQQSMWTYVRDIQHDMAARARWGITASFAEGEHAPELSIAEGLDFEATVASKLDFQAKPHNVDGGEVQLTWRIYPDASIGESWKKSQLEVKDGTDCAVLEIPADAKAGDTIHIIVCAEGDGPERLRHYQQIIVKIKA